MKEVMKYFLAAGSLLLFLPFLLTAVLSGKESVKLEKDADLEMLIPSAVYREIPGDAEWELIRAQAVLVRSRAFCMLRDQGSLRELLEENLEYEKNIRADRELLEACRQAAEDTRGQVLSCGGAVVEGPWFVCGNGKTREGSEAVDQEKWGWIVSVDSSADVDSPDYLSEKVFTEEELRKLLGEYLEHTAPGEVFGQIYAGAEDSAGYVTEVSVGTARLSGENFRNKLGLSSSCFTIQEAEDGLHFICLGKGHGLGMSQYGAGRMAEEGKTAEEILKYYFPNAQVTAV